MHIRYVKPTKEFYFYVEPSYITSCVPMGMVLLRFHKGLPPLYGINLNGHVAFCNSLSHAVELMIHRTINRRKIRD